MDREDLEMVVVAALAYGALIAVGIMPDLPKGGDAKPPVYGQRPMTVGPPSELIGRAPSAPIRSRLSSLSR